MAEPEPEPVPEPYMPSKIGKNNPNPCKLGVVGKGDAGEVSPEKAAKRRRKPTGRRVAGVATSRAAAAVVVPPKTNTGLPAVLARGKVGARRTVSKVGGIAEGGNMDSLAQAVGGSGEVVVGGWGCCGRKTGISSKAEATTNHNE